MSFGQLVIVTGISALLGVGYSLAFEQIVNQDYWSKVRNQAVRVGVISGLVSGVAAVSLKDFFASKSA